MIDRPIGQESSGKRMQCEVVMSASFRDERSIVDQARWFEPCFKECLTRG